jgi:hypothetical protein
MIVVAEHTQHHLAPGARFFLGQEHRRCADAAPTFGLVDDDLPDAPDVRIPALRRAHPQSADTASVLFDSKQQMPRPRPAPGEHRRDGLVRRLLGHVEGDAAPDEIVDVARHRAREELSDLSVVHRTQRYGHVPA